MRNDTPAQACKASRVHGNVGTQHRTAAALPPLPRINAEHAPSPGRTSRRSRHALQAGGCSASKGSRVPTTLGPWLKDNFRGSARSGRGYLLRRESDCRG